MLNQFDDKKMNNFFKECELFYYSESVQVF